jgi:hypothetical protein
MNRRKFKFAVVCTKQLALFGCLKILGTLGNSNIFLEGVKVNVMFPMCLVNDAPCHEDIRGSGVIAPLFLTSALDGGEWSTSHPGHFTPPPPPLREENPGTHWTGV